MPRKSKLQQHVMKLQSFVTPVDSEMSSYVEKIPHDLIIEPNMPVGVYMQEAYNVYFYAQDDRDILVRKGLDWEVVNELPRRIENLRQCEAIWWKARFGPTQSEREYERVEALSQKVREELMIDLSHLATFNKDIKQAVKNIEADSGAVDHLFDLNAIWILCEREQEKLQSIGSDPKLLEDIIFCAKTLPELSVQLKFEQSSALYNQTIRNQAYTFLLVAVEEIRRCAYHAFWNNKKHLKGYLSEYFRRTAEK
jgi:hypothetical protein